MWRTDERRPSDSLKLSPSRRKFLNLELVKSFTTGQLVGKNYFLRTELIISLRHLKIRWPSYFKNMCKFAYSRGMRWRCWLRHCATNRQVAASFPDGPHYGPGVDSTFNRNEYQGYLLGGKGGRCVELASLPPSSADYLEILGASTSWSPKGISRPVMGIEYTHSNTSTC
jgi:hypothetical protein